MFRLDNKGQTLVMFVVMIPIIALLITLVYDVGSAIYEKNRLSNTSYIVIEYGLDNVESISEGDIISLILKDTNNLSYISVNVDYNEIEIVLKKKVRGVVGRLFGFDLIEVNTHYKGTMIDDVKKIEKVE